MTCTARHAAPPEIAGTRLAPLIGRVFRDVGDDRTEGAGSPYRETRRECSRREGKLTSSIVVPPIAPIRLTSRRRPGSLPEGNQPRRSNRLAHLDEPPAVLHEPARSRPRWRAPGRIPAVDLCDQGHSSGTAATPARPR